MVSVLDHLPLILVALPLVGAVLTWIFAHIGSVSIARQLACSNAILSLVLALLMAARFDATIPEDGRTASPQMRTTVLWLADAPIESHGGITGLDVRFSLGVDGLSLWPLVTTALIVCAVLLSRRPVAMADSAAFDVLALCLASGAMLLFAAQDVVPFVVGLQCVAGLFFLLIGWWGGADRRSTAMKFATYYSLGGTLILLGLAGLVISVTWIRGELDPRRTALLFDLPTLIADGQRLSTWSETTAIHWFAVAPYLFLALLAGFAILMPVFPLHPWWTALAADAAAPVAALVAGILLKVGLYGWLRFVSPLFPAECLAWAPWLSGLALLGFLQLGLVALAQNDLRRFVGYAAAALVQLEVAGFWTLSSSGFAGGVLLSLALGCGPAAAFLLIGALEERYRTGDIDAFGGMAANYPRLGVCLGAALLSLSGLPWIGGCAAFLLIVTAVASSGGSLTVLLPAMIILSWGSIWILQRTLFGRFREPLKGFQYSASWTSVTSDGRQVAWSTSDTDSPSDAITIGRLPDLGPRDIAPAVLLLTMSLALSLAPQVFVNVLRSSLTPSVAPYEAQPPRALAQPGKGE